jgi:hypothetical protein
MRRPLALAAALCALLGAARAEAYCRSSVCPTEGGKTVQGKLCSPGEPDDCGIELQWRQPCIGFNVQEDASNQVDYPTAEATLTQAFAAWTAVDCDGKPPSIQVFDLGSAVCDALEYNQHAGNANVLMFRDDAWTHTDADAGGTADTIALTTVTYDVDKGDIYDADIEVNTANFHFTTGDTMVDVDLLGVLTHESGHFLGMAHTLVDGATMYPDYNNGDLGLRTLEADDMAGICEAYPPGREAVGACTGIPRHGFAPECIAHQTEVRCSASPGPGGAGGGGGAVGVMLAALAALKTRPESRSARGRSRRRAS